MKIHKWVDPNGTLMFSKTCLKCGIQIDAGHVYGEDDGKWAGLYIIGTYNQTKELSFTEWLRGLVNKGKEN